MENRDDAILAKLNLLEERLLDLKDIKKDLLSKEMETHTKSFLSEYQAIELAKATGAVSALIGVWGWGLSVISNGDGQFLVYLTLFLAFVSVVLFLAWAGATKDMSLKSLSIEAYVNARKQHIHDTSSRDEGRIINEDVEEKTKELREHTERVDKKLNKFMVATYALVIITVIVAIFTATKMGRNDSNTIPSDAYNSCEVISIKKEYNFHHLCHENEIFLKTQGDK